MTRRVVITGLGAVSCLGLDSVAMWQNLRDGNTGIAPIAAFNPAGFPTSIAGQVPEYSIRDFVPKSYRKATKLMCRDIELAVIAAHEAFKNSGLITKAIDENAVTIDPARTAAIIGAGLISCELPELLPALRKSITDGRFDIRKWGSDGLPMITPLWLLKYLPNMLACHVGILHDIRGPSNSITCGEVSGLLALSEARDIIARGSADVALSGGGEAKINPVVLMRQCLLQRAVPADSFSAAELPSPFDASANGSAFGEGAAAVILEEYSHASTRGANIIAEVLGAAESSNINPDIKRLEPAAPGLRIAIERAMAEAGIGPRDLDLIIPHGTGIPSDDAAEAAAIADALGTAVENIPAWPTKNMLSNTGAAAAMLDVVAAASAIRDGLIPAARNFKTPRSGCRLAIPSAPISKKVRFVLCCGYTYGAQTAAVVLGAVEG